MASLKALTLASVAVLALTRAAAAADLLPPPPAMEPPPPILSSEFNGWYLRGDVGAGFNNAPSFATSPDALAGGIASGFLSPGANNNYLNTSLSAAAIFDVGVGYQFNNWFRADVTSELRGGSQFQGLQVLNDSASPAGNGYTSQQFADFYRGNLDTYLLMLNGYVDVGTWYGITPFVGAGVGVAYNRFSGLTDNGFSAQTYPVTGTVSSATGGYISNGSSTNFAWSLMTGLDFNVTQNLKLELGYRYLNYGTVKSGTSNCLTGTGQGSGFDCGGGAYNVTTKSLTSNDFKVGLRWMIGENTPAPEAPLVRKY